MLFRSPGNDSFSYNEGLIELRISMTDYYLGYYVYKITYQYDNTSYYMYTSAISVNLSVDEMNIQQETFFNRLQEYIGGELSNEFTKKN